MGYRISIHTVPSSYLNPYAKFFTDRALDMFRFGRNLLCMVSQRLSRWRRFSADKYRGKLGIEDAE